MQGEGRAFDISMDSCARINAGLSKEQSHVVDDAISATDECGEAYGEVACRMGLKDGIRLASKIWNICSTTKVFLLDSASDKLNL